MNCIVCGAKLHGKQQIYCSKACLSRAMYAKRRTPGREYCKYCGAKLDSKSATRVFCGDRCRQNYYYRERHMESRAEAQQETTEPREITPTTVYLVHKYAAEGMPAGVIAQTLNRCMDDVGKALAQPITREQAEAIRECFVQYKPRRAE